MIRSYLLVFLVSVLPMSVQAQGVSTTSPESETPTVQSLISAIFVVPDLAAASEWYERAFGVAAYTNESYYVGFRIGEQAIGLIPEDGELRAGPGGSIPYFRVASADAAHTHLLSVGASPHSDLLDVGGGVLVASVGDPYGNLIGVIQVPPEAE